MNVFLFIASLILHSWVYLVFSAVFIALFLAANKHTDEYTRGLIVILYVIVNVVICVDGARVKSLMNETQRSLIESISRSVADEQIPRETIAEHLNTCVQEMDSAPGSFTPVWRLRTTMWNLPMMEQEKRWAQEDQAEGASPENSESPAPEKAPSSEP